MRGVRIGEARTLLGQVFTARIEAVFTHELAANAQILADPAGSGRPRRIGPRVTVGHDPAGWDPHRCPDVPGTVVEIHRDDPPDGPYVAFSYKVEYGYPPDAVLHVRRGWLREIATPGHAVLGGHPVLEVTARDVHARPTAIWIAYINGTFDTSLHGWRAWAACHHARVHWPDPAPPPLDLDALTGATDNDAERGDTPEPAGDIPTGNVLGADHGPAPLVEVGDWISNH